MAIREALLASHCLAFSTCSAGRVSTSSPRLESPATTANGDGDGQAYHARAGNAHTHGVFVNILAEEQLDVFGFAPQSLSGLGNTKGHRARFGAARGQHHLLAESVAYSACGVDSSMML